MEISLNYFSHLPRYNLQNENQEEGRPMSGYFIPPYNKEQNAHERRYRDKVWS